MHWSVKNRSAERFHKLYGPKQPKVVFYSRDFLDYTIMVMIGLALCTFCYGAGHVITVVAYVLGLGMVVTFAKRHGVAWRLPILLLRPQEILYMLAYKVQNLSALYVLAAGLLLMENVVIAVTPGWPHHAQLVRQVALWMFFLHLAGITAYRTVILFSHLRHRKLVHQVLMETPWRRAIRPNTDIGWEILHAYGTGVLTHIILLAPWYVVLRHAHFSLLLLPVMCCINVVIHLRWLRVFNAWFYRDHWLGHNSEFQFIFLHGTHHDAIPSGLIAVAENGLLEGFFRFTLGAPTVFYNPLVAFFIFTFDIKNDIDLHQYIPGVFPRIPAQSMEVFQHSTHHYGQLAPYSIAMKVDQPSVSEKFKQNFDWMPNELKNSIELDEELSGFQWDNPTQRKTISLFKKYQKDSDR